MGNAAMVCGGRGERDAVTVLQADGNVLSLYSRVRVVDLILDYPNHFVCHSSSLVLLQHGKILPLHTLLVPGEVYFLLPMPGADHSHEDDEEEADTSSLLHIEPPRRAVHRTGSMKFVISTEQFSKIMAGSIKEGRRGGHLHQSSSKRKRAVRASKVQKSPQPWRPALSSIEEVAAN
jgi:hypothetical protein